MSKNSSSSTSEKAQPDSKLQNASTGGEKVEPKEKIIEVLERESSGNKDENKMGGHEMTEVIRSLKPMAKENLRLHRKHRSYLLFV